MNDDNCKPTGSAADPTAHPYALMFPPMDESAYQALVDSMGLHGQRDPIIINARNQIIDGLNRYRACLKLRIHPKYDRRDISDPEALALVISNNIHRRHLSEAQRAAVAALVRKMKPANLPLTQDAAGRMFNVSVRSIRSAENVMELSPELHQLMVANKVSVHAAENALRVPERERAQAIAMVTEPVRRSRKKGKRPRGLPNCTALPVWKRQAQSGAHGAYGDIFNALYDLPQLLVDHPLSTAATADLCDELRKAITLLESGTNDSAHDDGECEPHVSPVIAIDQTSMEETDVVTTAPIPGFECRDVFGRSPFFLGRLPAGLDDTANARFEPLWNLHPEQSNEILMHGKMVPIPRYQQAFGRDYHFSGTVSQALPVPTLLAPFLEWVQSAVDARLNGLLLNWYDAEKRHYIGAHRDSRIGLVVGSPIVTISVGATRTFRLRPLKEKGFVDFEAAHGTVFVMPWETNLAVKHEVPHQASCTGRRISMTARAFHVDDVTAREPNHEVR